MFKTLCLLLVVILCGCTIHQQSHTFKETSEIKTYTYAEARVLSEDSKGFYNFFLLPDISPDQALAFEQKFAIEQGTSYNIFAGAPRETVLRIYHADVPVKTLEAYGEVIVGHLQAETRSTQLSTFWNAVALCVELCASIPSTYPRKKEAEDALIGLLLALEDDFIDDVDTEIHSVRRIVDRVKCQHVSQARP